MKTMANIQIPLSAQAVGIAFGADSSSTPRSLSSLALSIDDKTAAYVASYPGEGLGGFIVIPNQSLAGTKTVTITSAATDANGGALPPSTVQFDIVGSSPPPLATSVQFGSVRVGNFPGLPSDPGFSAVLI
jgi:hypothetical protein